MPFIGKQPEVGAYQLIDSITTSATATYALTVDGSAYFPASARNLIVSLNGVTQAPESAYTVSGSNIVFDSALTASDVIDYIMVIGDAVDIGTPSDGTVGTSQMSYPLGNFSSTGIDDNATSTAITIDSSQNVSLSGDLTVDTDTLYVNSTNNNVGIGTANPNSLTKLEVICPSAFGPGITVTDNGDASNWSRLDINNSNVTGELIIYQDSGGHAAIRNTVAAGGMTFIAGPAGNPSFFRWENEQGTERMRIDSSGNLQVTGTLGNATLEGNGAVLEFSRDGANYIAARGGSSSIFIFQTGGATERMRLDASGNLLVGLTSPIYTGRGVLQTQTGSFVGLNYNKTTNSIGQSGWAAVASNGDVSAYAMYYNSAISDNATYCSFFNGPDNTTHYLYTKNNVLRISASGLHIGSTNGTVVGTQTSDERIKNIESGFEYGLDSVMALTPIAYSFNNEQERRLGFGAQTTQAVVPEAVYDTGECLDGYDAEEENPMNQTAKSSDNKLAMEYVQLIPVLTKAIQEQQTIIEDLQTRLSALEAN